MMAGVKPEYIAAGANRHPSAADWIGQDSARRSLLAFGSGWNVAVWEVEDQVEKDGKGFDCKKFGISTLLVGHRDSVNTVKFLKTEAGLLLITGSVDKSIRVWQNEDPEIFGTPTWCVQVLDQHQSSVNCIAVSPNAMVFATGDAAATVKTWKVDVSETVVTISLLQSIQLIPRYFPLALALHPLNGVAKSYVLAVAGTSAIVQLYVADSASEFKLQATLSGHEGWIRSLDFTYENDSPEADLLLSSASQDKYVRLWRIHKGKKLPAAAAAGSDPALGAFLPGKSLSNKAHRFVTGEEDYSATFEALLLGHEDWIYSAIWRPGGETLQLLSASADNSLAIWEKDPTSGVWISIARLGEISAQKGSTTATGSTGGFWIGLWSPTGKSVACIGRTGSWRKWNYDSRNSRWVQNIGIGGHTAAVTGVAWSRRGDYLLSTSSDQTTRLHAKWKHNDQTTWHEMARPQIHGYDLNCVDTLGETQFVSGADEKLLRVFSLPKAVAKLLQNLCSIRSPDSSSLPDAANMPVLGLSNKAIEANPSSDPSGGPEDGSQDSTFVAVNSTMDLSHPPLEDHLSKNTLFPEIEKLYGHGYEISALAASYDGSLIATACKASSTEHAVIRLFETKKWTEIKPPLTAHSLTVTRLRFSTDDKYLLSVGRDRQWALFQAKQEGKEDEIGSIRDENGAEVGEGELWVKVQSNPKGHTRMILDAAWAAGQERAFATAGRDKMVKLWGKEIEGNDSGGKTEKNDAFVVRSTIMEEAPVTAVDFADVVMKAKGGSERAYLAVGTEAGRLAVYGIVLEGLVVVERFVLDASSCPSRAITQLSWRSSRIKGHGEKALNDESEDSEPELAVASEDFSLRVFALKALLPASAS